MIEHVKLSELKKLIAPIKEWLKQRYGEAEGGRIWDAVCRQYDEYVKELPDYGGRKNAHALSVYGGVLIFALYTQLPDQPPIEEMQDFVQGLFMAPFVKLGKIFDLNRKADMRLINQVFYKIGEKDRKQIKQYLCTFCNVAVPYDKENHAARYIFTQCPNAEFAKAHGLLHVLPVLCNSDFYGISMLNGTLIRRGTCGNSSVCDYCVVGSHNPMAQEYEIVKDEGGFLVSREKNKKD